MINEPLFIGLSHIGQVFSFCWSKKISNCAIFDFDKKNLNKLLKKKFNAEEPNLKNLKKNTKIKFLKHAIEIKKYKVIFLTLDTNLNQNNAKPNTKNIESYYKKISKIKFYTKVRLIIASQVPVGFTAEMKKKYPNKNLDTLYMVDTLKMGDAIKRFLNPEQLVFGSDEKKNKIFIKKYFKKFKCKKYLYNIEEAELLKIAININLFFNVTFANIMDEYSRSKNINYSNIIYSLRNDKRIGNYSYIDPSVSVSGGHLERDCFYLLKSKNNIVKKTMHSLIKFQIDRKRSLLNEFIEKKPKKKLNILIVGISYKKNSFSMVNSIFNHLIKIKKYNLFFYDDKFKLENTKYFKRVKTIGNIKKYNYIIYNYSNDKTALELKNKIKGKKFPKIINISNSTNKDFGKESEDIFLKKNYLIK